MSVSLGLTSDYILGHIYCTQYKSDVHFTNLRVCYTKIKDMNANNRFSKMKDQEPGSFYSSLGQTLLLLHRTVSPFYSSAGLSKFSLSGIMISSQVSCCHWIVNSSVPE
jgi:hypothetical protein